MWLCLGIFKVMEKENEKITKCQELAVEMNKVLHSRTKVTDLDCDWCLGSRASNE